MQNLPIYDVLDNIKFTLNSQSKLILQAPPGAGKSTVVPISLLKESWLEDKMIIMLEPRRVAARLVAKQMAKLLGEEVGHSVGYQVKMDSCFSKNTKLLVVTEAILVRKLQSDQAIEDVGLIIFDEFHERSIHTDLSLALSLQVQEFLRDDLKLLIMSATLNATELLNLLGDVPVITSKGRSFNIENIYLPSNIKQPDNKSMHQLLLTTTLKAIKEGDGDILVFLAGIKEIRTLQRLLNENLTGKDIEVFVLHSQVSRVNQEKAIEKSQKRKVILSTNIAQTSLTIDGVRIVIDSGLEKQSRYNYNNGMNHLELTFISDDSATQRAGRAGRLSDGKCYKLWHKGKLLQPSTKAEILRSDLSSLLLEISNWGIEDINELKFLDYPLENAKNTTLTLLHELKMLNNNTITLFGKKALSLGVHPRLAFMILRGNDLGFAYEASLLAALLSEKDILISKEKNVNIYDRFVYLYEKDYNQSYINTHLAVNILKQAEYFYSKLKKIEQVNKKTKTIKEENLATLLLLAYPDRLARRRTVNESKYKLSNSKGAVLNDLDSLFNEEFLVIASLNAQNTNSYINLALKISLETIEKEFQSDIQKKETISYNKENKKFEIKEQHYFYDLEIYSKPLSSELRGDFSKLILDLIKKEGLSLLSWSKKAIDLQDRVNFINTNTQNSFPDFSEDGLLKSLEDWLEPYLHDIKSVKELEALDIYNLLLGYISWDKQQELELLAPSYLKVPSGSKIKIDYSNIQTPILAVKIQEMFGLNDTPKIVENTIALQIHLLSPANRPIQITYDLKSFWDNSYTEVRKELFSKYKKHYWPDNPYEAVATNKTKKHM